MSSFGHSWKNDALCLGLDNNLFFDRYEIDEPPFDIRHMVDNICIDCPVVRDCYAYGKYLNNTGVWGGVYMLDGAADEELNKHKTADDWARLYTAITK